jgi:sugar/nucleoside kinase (ribokinase family)
MGARRRSGVRGETGREPPASLDADGRLDFLTIGNAIVDVIARTEDSALSDLGLVKGSMRLVDLEESERIYATLGPAVEVSGGSAANTAVGLASLGGRAAFVGRVADDLLGRVFEHDIRAAGVSFGGSASLDGEATARCLVLVSPDAERTMCTYLGAAAELGPSDVDAGLVRRSGIVYLEGYLFDLEPAKDAIRHAARMARSSGGRAALTLSDSFCVERHREDLLSLAGDSLDLLFGNDLEMCLLFEVDNLDAVASELRSLGVTGVVTLGANGSMVVTDAAEIRVPASPVSPVLDTTGAGDLYAAGFLFGWSRELPPGRCAELGSLAAAEVISHLGARPEASLHDLASKAGFS